MEMESNDSESDCIITDVIESRGKVSKINEEEPFLKRCKLEYEGFSIKSIRGDGHCIANCFAKHFVWTQNSEKTLHLTKISLNLMKMKF